MSRFSQPRVLLASPQSMIRQILATVSHVDLHHQARFPFLHAWLCLMMLHQASSLSVGESTPDELFRLVHSHIEQRVNLRPTRVRCSVWGLSHLLHSPPLLSAYRQAPWFCWTDMYYLPVAFVKQRTLFLDLMGKSLQVFETQTRGPARTI
jgi:hypothetical protein